MRRVCRILLVLVISIAKAGSVEARDELVMPFECGLERDRVRVTPSVAKRYPIIGEREQRAVMACGSDPSVACRTVLAHRFVIACDGADVSWMRVAAAIRSVDAAPAWIKEGRLNVVLPQRGPGSARPSCIERPTYALGRTPSDGRSASHDCRSGEYDQVVLPPGFAPVGEMGARLVLAGAVDEGPYSLEDEAGEGPIVRVSNVAGETHVARAEPDAGMDPGLRPVVYGAAYESSVSVDDWVTVVRAEESFSEMPRGDDDSDGPWAWLLGALALMTFVGLACTGHAMTRWTLRSPRRGAMNGAMAVAALLQQTRAVVAKLKDAGPLRDVLQLEIDLVSERLAILEAAARDGEEDAATASAQLLVLVGELERIRRIADSAAASLSGARPAGGLPRSKAEAYDILGVNADVSDGVLKKIVDALRMTWHPDHARDEDDRKVREDRIRQINIAWELLAPKRKVA